MNSQEENLILSAFHILSHEFSEAMKANGFYEENPNKGEMIALMHSELSECLEGIRKPHADEHCPEYTSEEVELADTIYRILHYTGRFKLRTGEALIAKHKYNLTRPYKHNKAF